LSSSKSPQPAVIRPELRQSVGGPARLPLRHDIPDDVLQTLRKIEGRESIHGVFATLAHSPVVAKRAAVLIAGLLGKTKVPAREREIVVLRMGWRCGALYEFAGHIGIGMNAGLTEEEIGRLTLDEDAARFSSDDAALVRLADELYDANAVSAATWDALAERWTQEELVELVAVAGAYWMMSNLLNAFRIQPEEGWPGWPDATAPTGLD
jgi:alkylhydroperoxidase family enzyme